MKKIFHNTADLIRKIYILATPYGRRKLAFVSGLSLAQGIFQVLGVTSIFPFLALAAAPERLRNSQFGNMLLDFLPEMDNDQLLLLAGYFAIFMLLASNGVNLLAEFTRTRYAHRFGHWLRTGLLRKIASRPYGDFLKENSSILVKKVVGDVMQFTTGVLLPLLDSFARLITVALLVISLFFVHKQIALIAAFGLGAFYVIVFKIFGKWRAKTTSGLRASNRASFAAAQQLFSGIKPIKVHRAEEPFIERFSIHSAIQARLMAWVAVTSGGPRYLLEPLAFGGVVAAVLLYVSRGQDLAAILPNLGVMALAGYRLLPALQLLYSQINQLTTMRHALDEIYDEYLSVERSLAQRKECRRDRLEAPTPLCWERAITLEEVSFQYPGTESPTIDKLSLRIPRNSSLGIVGTTGCGKSTLVDLILGLHVPTSGRILFDDTELAPENRRAWRGSIGYVPQDIFLIDDTIAANVAFGIHSDQVDQDSLRQAAKAAQILDFIEDLPNSWETGVGERGIQLSGGQRQRIGIARALYHKPAMLILDEATSALDQETERRVIDSTKSLQGSLTIIIVAHRHTAIEGCDQCTDLSEAFLAG